MTEETEEIGTQPEEDTATASDVEATAPEEAPGHEETPASGIDETEVARLVAEAEERGYLRGRNEAIAERMEQPALWENTAGQPSTADDDRDADYASLFLSELRPGVWD